MTSALLSFFWDANAPVAPVVVEDLTTPGHGSGGTRRNSDIYIPLDFEYWENREAVIRHSNLKQVEYLPPPPPPGPTAEQIAEWRFQLATLQQRLPEADSVETLKSMVEQIRKLKVLTTIT